MTSQRDQDDDVAETGTAAGVDRPGHLGYVAHEIRNPLSTALWTSELLGRISAAERGGARGEKLAALCLRALTRVRLLVEDHLLCERLDAGGYPIRVERVPLGELLAAIQARWPVGGGGLSVPEEAGLAALGDRTLLERALDGLLATAAGVEDGPVKVEAGARDGRLEIRVVGGLVASLSDPARGAVSDQRGRALALPMARRVAVALGGSLAVDGEGYLLSIPAA
jgi:K+-sensing histidine kinase KdpD